MAAFRRLREKLGLRKAEAWPAHVSVGRHTYGLTRHSFVRPTAQAPASIGSFCSFGPEVMIFGQADHPVDLPSTYPFRSKLFAPEAGITDAVTKGGVTIGHDVWVGARAIILSGVTIGNGAIIGAGAVVAKDVPAYAIAVGNPVQVLKYRFTPEIIAALQDLRWWDWPEDKLRAFETELYGPVEAFIARAKA